MLTADEQQALLASIARVQALAGAALARTGQREQAIRFVVNLHRSLDKVAAQAGARGLTTDCQVGCAHCCRLRVEATEPEVFRIARRVRRWPAAELAQLVGRLQRHAAEPRPEGVAGHADCGFLVAGQCSIYEARPSACRKAHSLSVQHCANLAPEIPQDLHRVLDAEALIAGTAAAYREAGLPAGPHELNAAVLAAVGDNCAEARWYDGQTPF